MKDADKTLVVTLLQVACRTLFGGILNQFFKSIKNKSVIFLFFLNMHCLKNFLSLITS